LINWPAHKPDNKATIIFDRKTEVRIDHEAELLALLKKATPPVDRSAMRRDDKDDEEEMRAWRY
jgi:hypothetical protein